MAGRDLFAADQLTGAGQPTRRKGRNLFSDAAPSAVPSEGEVPAITEKPSLEIPQMPCWAMFFAILIWI